MISTYHPSHEWDKTNAMLQKPLKYLNSDGTLLLEVADVDAIKQVMLIDVNRTDHKTIYYKLFVFEAEGRE